MELAGTVLGIVARSLFVAIGTAVLAEAAGRAGAGPLALLSRRRFRPLERFGLELLLGFAAIGFAYFGLALAGLFRPFVLPAAAIALVAASRRSWRRSALIDAAREAGTMGRPALVLAAALVPAFGLLLAAEWHPDCWAYHLGVPWQYLQAGRAVYEHVPLPFNYPLTFELVFGLPLVFEDDRFAKAVVFLCFLGASAVFSGWCLRTGRRTAAWLGPLLVISSPAILDLATLSKSDVPGAAMFVTGIVMQMQGASALAAVLLGICPASKLVYVPLVAAFGLAFMPRARRAAWWVGLMAIPFAPWVVKTWLATGNPVFPFASEVFPSLNWGEPNHAVWAEYRSINVEGLALRMSRLRTALGGLARPFLPVLLALPGLAMFSRRRKHVMVSLAAIGLMLSFLHTDRYILPVPWLLILVLAGSVEAMKTRRKTFAAAVLAVYSLLAIALSPVLGRPGWAQAGSAWVPLRDRIASYARIAPLLSGSQARGKRVVSVGEWRTYGFPVRLIFNGMRGETPLIWKLARESHTPEDIARKFRQLGADRILYDYVSDDFSVLWYVSFTWDERSLRRYVDFCKRYLVRMGGNEKCRFAAGSFYVHEVRRRPVSRPRETIWYAPGTEIVFSRGMRLENMRRLKEALAEYQAILRVIPDVGSPWNHAGHVFTAMNEFNEAMKYLRPFAEEGMLDSGNLGDLAMAALGAGELELADRVLSDALERYPHRRGPLMINRASWHVQKGMRELNAGRLPAAEEYVAEGLAVLERLPAGLSPQQRATRDSVRASLWGVRGEIHLVRGEHAAAREWFTRALALAPRLEMAARWKRIVQALSPIVPGLDN